MCYMYQVKCVPQIANILPLCACLYLHYLPYVRLIQANFKGSGGSTAYPNGGITPSPYMRSTSCALMCPGESY